MAISSYAGLVSSISEWLARNDTEFAARVPDFIAMFEARANRVLRLRAMETSATGATVAGVWSIALPSDLRELASISFSGSGSTWAPEIVSPEAFVREFASSVSGTPAVFAVSGANALLAPTPDGAYTYTIRYYAGFAPLSASNESTHGLFTAAPDLYLFGALTEAESYIGNDARMPLWKARVEEIFAELQRQDWQGRYKGAAARVRVA